MPKKVYIAGKISGTKDYMGKFEAAERFLVACNYVPINPAKVLSELPEKDMEHEDYMHICFAIIDICDAVWFMDGWKESKGATQEFYYAASKNKILLRIKELETKIGNDEAEGRKTKIEDTQ